MKKTKEVKRIGVTEILGKEIVFYGTWEEPLFLGSEVADWIEHKQVSRLLNLVDVEEKLMCSVSTSGQSREMWFMTEDGLYETLMQSRKLEAKELRKGIKQHLKQIRKTGGTIENGREDEFVDKYFPSFSDEVKLSMVQDLLKTNKKLKPKADYCDRVLIPLNLITITDIAKDLGMSGQALNKQLHEKKVIYPKKVKNKIQGWYTYSDYDYLIPQFADYSVTEYGQSLKWTERGRKFILELMGADTGSKIKTA